MTLTAPGPPGVGFFQLSKNNPPFLGIQPVAQG